MPLFKLLDDAILLISVVPALAFPLVAFPPSAVCFTEASPVSALLFTVFEAVALFAKSLFLGPVGGSVGDDDDELAVLEGFAEEFTPAAVVEVCVAFEPSAVASVGAVGVVGTLLVDVAGVCCDVVGVFEVLDDEVSLSANELPVCVVAASNNPPIIVPAMRCRFFLVLISLYLLLLYVDGNPWRVEPDLK